MGRETDGHDDEACTLDVDSILAVLEDAGLRATRPRRLIAKGLAALSGSDFVTEDLWRDLQASEPSIGRATVYRTVELLQRQGLLDRVSFSDGTHRYRLCSSHHHHHVTCVQCQRVVEVGACLSPEVLAQVASATNFAIEGHSVEIFGRCSLCR